MNAPLSNVDKPCNVHKGRSLACTLCKIRDQSICVDMDQRDLYQVEKTMARRFMPKHHALMSEGDANSYLYVLVEGSCRLSKHLEDGRRQVTGFAFPGDILGVRKTDSSAYTAETLEDCHVCCFPHSFLEQASENAPSLKDRLIARGQTEYHKAQDHIVLLGKRTSTERVKCFINMLDEAVGRDLPNSKREVPLSMARRDIADYLGLRLETLSRTLSSLKKEGYLADVSKHTLVVNKKA